MDSSCKNIFICGHKGLLGQELLKKISKKARVYTTNEKFPSKTFIDFVKNGKFDFIINCACKKEGKWEDLVCSNIELPVFLKKQTSNLIHFCTDAVYSGKVGNYYKKSPHDPICDYGKTKSIASKLLNRSTILRTSFVSRDLRGAIKQRIESGEFYGWDNYLWSGVYLEDLAEYVSNNFENLERGIFLVGGDKISKYELYKKLYRGDLDINKKMLEKNIDRSYNSDIYLPMI